MNENTCWRASDSDTEPLECTFNGDFGFPNYCTLPDGTTEKFYENIHFLKYEDAWERIYFSIKAELRYVGDKVKQARNQLRNMEIKAADALERNHEINSNPKNPYKEK